MHEPESGALDRRFKQLIDILPVAAYACDPSGLITHFNAPAVEIWGRVPKLNDPADRYCGSFRLFSATGAPVAHIDCWMAHALRSGTPHQHQEIVIERSDGTRVTVLANASPLHNEAGKLIGAVNILIDVRNHLHAESATALLASIVESSDDAIVSKSLDGHILTWNSGAERIFGYKADEVIGRPITLIIPIERHHEEHAIQERLRLGERIDHFETVRLAKDGRLIDVSLTVSPIRDHSGRVVGASKVARDISDRKESERALREADQRKDEFLATLAHELRNPLAPLSNSLHLLQMNEDRSPAVTRLHDIMDRQISHMVRLVDDLLDVSRITRGKIELRKIPVELAAVVASAVETSRPAIDAAGHQLAITISPEPMILEADAVRLSQVLANLLNNAAKYTNTGGQIWLTARREGDDAVISVRDNGLGIPPDMLKRVFNMFSQVDQTRTRAQGGLGIGLTLAQSLVQLHGGRIEVHSDGIGLGSEFTIILPLSVSEASLNDQHPGSSRSDLDQQPSGAGRRVLIVDDTHSSAFVLGKLLETMGHEAKAVTDGKSAIQEVRSWRPDIVISDIAMPDMDGYELARRLRREPGAEGIMLAALTGYSQESDRQRALDAGFDRHLVKPVGIDALQELLRHSDASMAQ